MPTLGFTLPAAAAATVTASSNFFFFFAATSKDYWPERDGGSGGNAYDEARFVSKVHNVCALGTLWRVFLARRRRRLHHDDDGIAAVSFQCPEMKLANFWVPTKEVEQ